MARIRGDGSVYQDKVTGRWRAVVPIGTDDTGRPKRVYLTAATAADVELKRRKLIRARDAGTLPTSGSLTVQSWLTIYLDTLDPTRVRPRTAAGYREKMRNYVVPAIGRVRLDRLRPEHLERVTQAMRDKGRSPSTIAHTHRVLRRALKIAYRRGHLTADITTMVDVPSAPPRTIQPFTRADARKVLVAAAGTRRESRWSVAFAVGLRQGEALALAWDMVDLDAGTLRVERELVRLFARHGCDPRPGGTWSCKQSRPGLCPRRIGTSGLVLDRPKSEASRRNITLPATLVDALRRRRIEQDRERVEEGRRWKGWTVQDVDGATRSIDLVWGQRSGAPVDSRRDWQEWRDLLGAAGVDARRLHDARHTCATLLLAQGVPARVVMDVLGHAAIGMTVHYTKVAPELAVGAAEQMDDALWGTDDLAARRRQRGV